MAVATKPCGRTLQNGGGPTNRMVSPHSSYAWRMRSRSTPGANTFNLEPAWV